MRRLTDISPGSVSLLLPVYSYYSVLVSYRFLDDATYRLSYRFLDDATGENTLIGIISNSTIGRLSYKSFLHEIFS